MNKVNNNLNQTKPHYSVDLSGQITTTTRSNPVGGVKPRIGQTSGVKQTTVDSSDIKLEQRAVSIPKKLIEEDYLTPKSVSKGTKETNLDQVVINIGDDDELYSEFNDDVPTATESPRGMPVYEDAVNTQSSTNSSCSKKQKIIAGAILAALAVAGLTGGLLALLSKDSDETQNTVGGSITSTGYDVFPDQSTTTAADIASTLAQVAKTTANILYSTFKGNNSTTSPMAGTTTSSIPDKTTSPMVDTTTSPMVDTTTSSISDKTTSLMADTTTESWFFKDIIQENDRK